MKNSNAHIISVGSYHPKNKFDNEFFIDHFNKMGINIQGVLDSLGRKTRYFVDNDTENAVTMAAEASKIAIEKAGLTKDMLDMVVFVTDTPEFLIPTNALKLSRALECKPPITYDLNACCTGMITAIDQVSRHMKTDKKVKYALIAGSICISPHASEKDFMFYATFGDGSSAIIIESREEDCKKGFIDSAYLTNPEFDWSVNLPVCGLSNIHKDDVEKDKKYAGNLPFDFGFLADEWSKVINQLLENNNLSISDIDCFLFSQFSITAIRETMEKLNVDMSKAVFVGDQFGYTGCTSPILALEEALKTGQVKKDSKAIFISVGAGYNISSVLIDF